MGPNLKGTGAILYRAKDTDRPDQRTTRYNTGQYLDLVLNGPRVT
jgi:hypothetical protein